MNSPTHVVWTQHLPDQTRVHRYDHGTLDLPDRRVGEYEHWLTACGKVPVKYRLRGSGIVRSAGAQLTEAQAGLLGLEFCDVCFAERWIETAAGGDPT